MCLSCLLLFGLLLLQHLRQSSSVLLKALSKLFKLYLLCLLDLELIEIVPDLCVLGPAADVFGTVLRAVVATTFFVLFIEILLSFLLADALHCVDTVGATTLFGALGLRGHHDEAALFHLALVLLLLGVFVRVLCITALLREGIIICERVGRKLDGLPHDLVDLALKEFWLL